MKMLKDIALFISGIIFGYLITSFIKWNFNPASWGNIDRAGTICCSMSLGMAIVLISKMKIE